MDWRADIIFERLRPGSMLGVMPEHEPLRAELARRASGTDCRFVSAADLLHEDFAIARSRLAYGLRQVRQVRQYTVESGPLNLYHYDIYDYKLTPLMAQQQRLGTPGAVGKGALVGEIPSGYAQPSYAREIRKRMFAPRRTHRSSFSTGGNSLGRMPTRRVTSRVAV